MCEDCKYIIRDEILDCYVCTNYDSDFSDESIWSIQEKCSEFIKKDTIFIDESR